MITNETNEACTGQSVPEKADELRYKGMHVSNTDHYCGIEPAIIQSILSTNKKRLDYPNKLTGEVLQSICKMSKQGTSIAEICETLGLAEDQAVYGLTQTLAVSSEEMEIVRMMGYARPLQQISEVCDVSLTSLLQVFSYPVESRFMVMEPRLISSKALMSLKKLKPFEFEVVAKQGAEQRPAVELENGEVYQGEWSADNSRHGRGVQEWPDGRRFEGNWFKDKRSGKGRLIKPSGYVWECNWVDDYPDGEILLVESNGNHITGLFTTTAEGVNKQIRVVWSDGQIYEGSWANDMINGEACYTLDSGVTFTGNMKDNYMHGVGKMKWPNGNLYTGAFEHDRRHGQGALIHANGRMREGLWRQGIFIGTIII